MKSASAPQNAMIFNELFSETVGKSQRRQIQIVETTIELLSTIGIENTTHEKIAKACKISRPLVLHYFPSRDGLFQFVFKYIRANFQLMAIQALSQSTSPLQQLEDYIQINFEWIKKYSSHSKVWALFFYFCCTDKTYLNLNTELVQMGQNRLASLLQQGKKSGFFKCKKPALAAKLIQVQLTGALVSLQTENEVIKADALFQETVKICKDIAGAK